MDLAPLARRARNAVGARILRASPRMLRLIAGPPRTIDGATLDLRTQALLRLAALSRVPEMCDLGPARARRFFASNAPTLDGIGPPVDRVEEMTAPGPGGALPVRLYVPKRDARIPAALLVWYHGGGFVVGGLETHDAALRRLANEAGCLVLSVEYRKAPEHPFPAAVDDALAAFRWAQERAGSLGANPARVAVGGDSAGGNLAAVIAQLTRSDRPPCLQVLVYPATELARTHASHRLFSDGYLLTKRTIDWFMQSYLGNDASLIADPRASPLRAADMTGLAPAIVATAGFDPLRDEGREYAERLRKAGVQVERLDEPGLIHGYFAMAALPAPREAGLRIADAVRRALG